jgi:hypothetical protein
MQQLAMLRPSGGLMIYECERCRRIDASAETVWQWMADVRHLLRLNIFHAAVDAPTPVMQVGVRVPIQHNVCGVYRRIRMAHIRVYRPYVVAWSELQAKGADPFPHSQMFTIVPLDAQHCLVRNRLRGKFNLLGARYWLLPFYRWLAPCILDHENRRIAAAVAAVEAAVPRAGAAGLAADS